MDFLLKGNWQRTDYFNKNAPDVTAVYVVIFNEQLLYVGCTHSLKQRLYSHGVIKRICRENKIKNTLIIHFIETKIRNTKFESFIINKYKPKYNGGLHCYWGEKIKKKLDGRTISWLTLELRMPDLGVQMRGIKPFKKSELQTINNFLQSR